MPKIIVNIRLFVLIASICLFTNLFSLLSPIKLGPLNNLNLGFIFLFLSSFGIRYFNFTNSFFNKYYFFLLSLSISLILTLLKGYDPLNSIKVFALVLPFYCLPSLTRNLESRLTEKRLQFILGMFQLLTFILSLLFIFQNISQTQIFAVRNDYGRVEGTGIIRSLNGYPELMSFFWFYTLYLVINFKKSKDIFIFSIFIIATFFTFSRGLIISLVLVSIYLLIIQGKNINYIKYIGFVLIIVLGLFIVFPDYFNAFTYRFREISEANSIGDVRNLDFRLKAFIERFNLFLNRGFLFGVGFIHQNEITDFGLHYSYKLIHDDIFYANMLTLFGAVGSSLFIVIISHLIKVSHRLIDNEIAFSFLGFLLFELLNSLSAGSTFIHGSYYFTLFTALFLCQRFTQNA